MNATSHPQASLSDPESANSYFSHPKQLSSLRVKPVYIRLYAHLKPSVSVPTTLAFAHVSIKEVPVQAVLCPDQRNHTGARASVGPPFSARGPVESQALRYPRTARHLPGRNGNRSRCSFRMRSCTCEDCRRTLRQTESPEHLRPGNRPETLSLSSYPIRCS